MNRDLIPKYTLRGESYIDFHGLRYKTYIFSFKAEEILNTVSLNHLYDVLKEVQGEFTKVTFDVTICNKDLIREYGPIPYLPHGKDINLFTGNIYVRKGFYYKTLYKGMCVRISLNLQGYPIEITIDMLGYPSSSVIQKLYEIHKQGEFINAL